MESSETQANGDDVMRVAMWSGPRNISTALMRSWENRGDTYVCDEPLYAYYLQRTRSPHPGMEEIIARGDTNWESVVRYLTGPPPEGRRVFFQKHMAHHLLPEVDRDWLRRVVNCFLVRDPDAMLLSLAQVLSDPSLDDTGLPRQVEIMRFVRDELRQTPIVLESRDVLKDPAGILRELCERLGLPFTESMLQWPTGRRSTDGVWAKHWYAAVETSTGFRPYEVKSTMLPEELRGLAAQCRPLYEELCQYRLSAKH